MDMEARSKLLTRKEAAEYLGVKPQTLACWAVTGKYGLPVVKVGRAARYRLSDLEKWLSSRTVGAIAEGAEGAGREQP
jgi:excisionase family DNA binding protein